MYELFEKLPQEKKALILSTGIREFSLKAYSEVSTDIITKNCGISKGLLFHYFGSKKLFYEYCVTEALNKLFSRPAAPESGDFYTVLFSAMDGKLRLCLECPDETRLVNTVSRDTCREALELRNTLFARFMAKKNAESMTVMTGALKALPLKEPDNPSVISGILLYSNAIMQKYLLLYQDRPEEFFEKSEEIKASMKEYLDFMLYGIV